MPKVYCLSDRAIQIDWPADDAQLERLGGPSGLAQFRKALVQGLSQQINWPFQCVQADCSLTVLFASSWLSGFNSASLLATIRSVLESVLPGDGLLLQAPNHHVLDVHYGGDHGQDLLWLAQQVGLSPEAVVDLHAQASYTVNFLGFLPGFAYLSGLPARLQLPRRTNPRPKVPAGSLAIGAHYCAVYPWESPGGWHLIGHVYQPLFDVNEADGRQALLQAGDTVTFRPVNHA